MSDSKPYGISTVFRSHIHRKLQEKNIHLVSWNSPSTQSMHHVFRNGLLTIYSDLSITAWHQLRGLVDLLCIFLSLQFCFWSWLRIAVSFYFSIATFEDQLPCPCIRSLKEQRRPNSFPSTKANAFFPWRQEEGGEILFYLLSAALNQYLVISKRGSVSMLVN